MSQPPFPLPFEDDEPSIDFSYEEVAFELKDEEAATAWLQKIIEQEGCVLHLLNFIFCSDDYLLRLNVEYLDHDTLTDIITFPYADPPTIHGDIFISIDRVRDNAADFKVPFEQELNRVMAHGVLHLCGYGDKSPAEERTMRQKEEEALKLGID
ncbi:MAG: rRNA maturation RNase YbeY [Saprospiraceae bacterium]|jgi:rRNA maturation RNase YbeY|nr:rRNA maturation RNase YbeY [Saprospiraceae bacterium]